MYAHSAASAVIRNILRWMIVTEKSLPVAHLQGGIAEISWCFFQSTRFKCQNQEPDYSISKRISEERRSADNRLRNTAVARIT